jgi:hypothetical protein
MRRFIRTGGRRGSRGSTLSELMVALAVGGFVIAAVFAVMTQLFHLTTSNTSYMAAFREVQDAGNWISRDALMSQAVYGTTTATLTDDIDADDTIIPVDSTAGFPEQGVISIGDELIQYTFITEDSFGDLAHPVVRGENAVAHVEDDIAGFLVALDWVGWAGDHHQIFYNVREGTRQMARSYLVDGSLTSRDIIADDIDPAVTLSTWDASARELVVAITATITQPQQWQAGDPDYTAQRIYKINPRPFY